MLRIGLDGRRVVATTYPPTSSFWRNAASDRDLRDDCARPSDAATAADEDVENVDPLDRVAVTVVASRKKPKEWDASTGPVLAPIQSALGNNVGIIPMRFGSAPDVGKKTIEQWLAKDLPE